MQIFLQVARFECRSQLSSMLFPFLALVFFIIHYFAGMRMGINIDANSYGAALNLNAAIIIIRNEVILSGLLMFPVIALVATAITRDYDRKTAELFFAAPVSEGQHFSGRFIAGFMFAALVGTAGLLGHIAGLAMPWLDHTLIGDFQLAPFLFSLGVIVLPNMFVFSAIAYAAAALTRSIASAFSVALLFMALSIAVAVTMGQEDRIWAALLGPFGFEALTEESRYWTAAELNNNIPGGLVLINRAIWLCIGTGILLLARWRFRFRLDAMTFGFWPARKERPQPPTSPRTRQIRPRFSLAGTLQQLLSQLRMDVRGIIWSPPFLVMLALSVAMAMGTFVTAESLILRQPLYPVTATMIANIRLAAIDFLPLGIIYFSAELVHRARQAQVSEMADALPVPDSVSVLSEVLALCLMVTVTFLVMALSYMIMQASSGYTDFEFALYFTAIFGFTAFQYFMICVGAIVVQILSPNKWVGMGMFLVLSAIIASLPEFGFEHLLYGYRISSAIWSDMNGWGHFVLPTLSLTAYWAAFCVVLLIIAQLATPRGLYDGIGDWFSDAKSRVTGSLIGIGAAAWVCFLILGGWIFYNSNVLNEYRTPADVQRMQAAYEKAYKPYADDTRLDLVSIDAEFNIFPTERRLESRGTALLQNSQASAVAEILLTVNPAHRINSIEITGASQFEENLPLGVYRYRFETPLDPGASVSLDWHLSSINRGFPNSQPNNEVVENGTYVIVHDYMPIPAYREDRELEDPGLRRAHGLPTKDPLPALGDQRALNTTYLGSSRVDYRMTIGTSADQVAVTQGILKREWTEDGRRYFRYETESPVWILLGVLSARYEVTRETWNGIELEVFHDPRHGYSIGKMLETAKQGIEYYSESFSPYQYSQFRIVEFPRYSINARGMPGTVPYSEGIGFLTDFRNINSIDFGTAHELAHQWWAQQVRGARMQGVELLSEGLASYAAVMLMKKINGADQAHVTLRTAVDGYLRARGTTGRPEVPVMYTDADHISYSKAASVMYALQDVIGEDKVNGALQTFLGKYAFRPPPFPTSQDLVNELRAVAEDQHQDFITDLFEKITFYDLSVTNASSREVGNGFEITMDIVARQTEADGAGVETEVPLKTWLDIAVFEDDDLFGGAAPLYLKKHLIMSGETRIVVKVAKEAVGVGIDPYGKMIDRNFDDNLLSL